MTRVKLDFKLHPKQTQAFKSQAQIKLYGGAAGGGKSHLARVAWIVACSSIKNLQAYLIRRKRVDLIKNHLEGPNGFRNLLAPLTHTGEVSIVGDEIRFHTTGSRIYLSHCKDEKNKYDFQGAEIHLLGLDEATHFTKTQFEYFLTRLRAPGVTIPDGFPFPVPSAWLFTNPGGIGHAWAKERFVDPAPPYEIFMGPGGMTHQYIPALLDDNPSMMEDDPGYEARLANAGSDALVQALRWGT